MISFCLYNSLFVWICHKSDAMLRNMLVNNQNQAKHEKFGEFANDVRFYTYICSNVSLLKTFFLRCMKFIIRFHQVSRRDIFTVNFHITPQFQIHWPHWMRLWYTNISCLVYVSQFNMKIEPSIFILWLFIVCTVPKKRKNDFIII